MVTVKNLGATNSLFNQYIAEIRSIEDQKDSMRFRRNMERIGEIFAYEISKIMTYSTKSINTPLGELPMELIENQPVLATILRAGLPLHQGLLNYFDKAENATPIQFTAVQHGVLTVNALALIVLGILPNGLIQMAVNAVLKSLGV